MKFDRRYIWVHEILMVIKFIWKLNHRSSDRSVETTIWIFSLFDSYIDAQKWSDKFFFWFDWKFAGVWNDAQTSQIKKKLKIWYRFRDFTPCFQSPTFLCFYVENRALVALWKHGVISLLIVQILWFFSFWKCVVHQQILSLIGKFLLLHFRASI